MQLTLSTKASARRIARWCLEVRTEKKKEILSSLDTSSRIMVIEEMTQIKEKREKSI